MGLRRRASKCPLAESPDTSPPGFSEAALRHHSRRLSRYSEIAAVTSGRAPSGATAALRLRLSKYSKRLWVDKRRIAVLLIRHVAQEVIASFRHLRNRPLGRCCFGFPTFQPRRRLFTEFVRPPSCCPSEERRVGKECRS